MECFEKVLLKNGKTATIVDKLGDSYIVDVEMCNDYNTQLINKDEIAVEYNAI